MKTKVVSFNTTKKDGELIVAIVVRAASMFNLEQSLGSSRLDLSMDLTACHVNGCPLNLKGLLKADKFDFAHDIFGISRHIDRNTGALRGCFCPRYSLPEDEVIATGDLRDSL